MANLTQEATEAVVRETPEVISLTKEAWQAVMNKPELRKLLQTFDVTPSTTGKMSIKLSGAQEADSLAATLKGATTPPSGAGRGPEIVNPAKFTNNDVVDPAKLPAVVPPAATPPPGVDPKLADVPWNKPAQPLSSVLKAGAGAALVGGAAYGAMQAGSDPKELPASTPPGPPPGTKLGGGSAAPTGDIATVPGDAKRTATKVSAPKVIANTGELEAELKLLDADIKKTGANQEWTQTDEDKWNEKMTQLQAVADAAQKRNMWAEAGERIGQALTQLFAANQGLKSGVDMSGLKFDKTDWSKKTDQILDRLKQDIGMTQDQKRGARETVKTARDALDRLKERRLKISGDVSKMKQDASEANARNSLQADTANQDADMDLIRVESDEKKNSDRIDAQTRAAMLKSLGTKFKDDVKKQADFQKVIAQIQTSKNPQDLEDKNIARALQLYISAGLGDEADFEAVLPNVDTAGWDSDSEMKQNWVREISQKTGLSAPAPARTEVRRQINPGTGQIKIFYSDNTSEIIEPAKK